MYMPMTQFSVPRHATACGLPYYEVQPTYIPDAENSAENGNNEEQNNQTNNDDEQFMQNEPNPLSQ